MSFAVSRRQCWLAVAIILASGVGACAQTVSINTSNDPAIQQLRQASLGLIEKGQWASADAAVKQLLTKDPDDVLGQELRRLMTSYDRVDRIRRDQREVAFKDSVSKVANFIAKESWDEALAEATRSADLAAAKADLQQQPWFAQLIDKSTKLAQGHCDKGEWLKATTTYSLMAALYEKENNQYKQLAKKTTRYARLEAIYRDAKEADKAVERIDEGMMAAALEQIKRFYVKEPDYKKMALGGVDALIALTEVPALAKSLPALEAAESKDKMRKDLTALREQVNNVIDQMGLQELAQTYVKAKRVNQDSVKLPEGVIIREFFDGSLEPLDQFSTMIWPSEKTEFDKSMRGEFSGVGIQISLEAGELTVVSPLEDTPAYRAGVQAGDVIVAIDGEGTEKITLDQAVRRITGKADTAVVLSVRRGGPKATPRDYKLVREKIVIKTVKGFLREKSGSWDYLADKDYKIGYVRITNFMPHTVEELDQAMDAMAAKGVRGLILDFRFNPGGLLNQAVEMSDLFISEGVIVSTEGRATRKLEERAHEGGTNKDLPLVVLVNEFSASAAEIVSGALKDHNRAIIVGERSFGKGSVQNVIPVGAGAGDAKDAPAYLKLTTALYYLPSGRSLHRHEDSETWGVEPGVPVKVTRDEIQDILDLRRDSDVIHQPNEVPTTRPENGRASSRPDHLRQDPQIETGLMVLRAELLKKKI
ncbi:MAG: S41 family peptidase [Phycisphaerae bacterium]|nr:S41 family peptidase [Phycisphaerae bacterium]